MTDEACINYETEYNFKKWDLILANAVICLKCFIKNWLDDDPSGLKYVDVKIPNNRVILMIFTY